jgi:hypothetical protein
MRSIASFDFQRLHAKHLLLLRGSLHLILHHHHGLDPDNAPGCWTRIGGNYPTSAHGYYGQQTGQHYRLL